MSRITTDLSKWPTILISLPDQVAENDLALALDRLERALFEAERSYSLIFDLKLVQSLGKASADILSQVARTHRERGLCRGIALLLESALVKGALTSLFWHRSSAFPIRLFNSRTSAKSWSSSLHRDHEAAPPATILTNFEATQDGWILQGQATRKRSMAERLAERLVSEGLPSTVTEVSREGSTLFVVWVGPYPDRSVAMRKRDELEATGVAVTVAPQHFTQ